MRNWAIVAAFAVAGIWLGSGVSALAAATEFDVVLSNQLDSKTAKVGDAVEARLASDLHIGSKVVAKAGSKITGHVTEVFASRRLIRSEFSTKRWLRAGAGIGMEFDQVLPAHSAPLKVKALPVAIATSGAHDGKKSSDDVTMGKDGTVEAARKRDMKPKFARSVLGVAAFVAGPVTAVAGAAVGAVRPQTVLPEATDTTSNHDGASNQHRRLKGMATGFVAGLPGGFLVNDTALKGQQAVLKAGTRLTLELSN